MQLSENVILRPRFKMKRNETREQLITIFETAKATQEDYKISIVDDHIFIRIPKAKQHFWSPQLHLELRDKETSGDITLHGLFGPNPTVWTLFMFLHFLVATLFIGAGVWAYGNAALDKSIAPQITMMIILIAIWFALYFGGRMGRATGNKETNELYSFMKKTLKDD